MIGNFDASFIPRWTSIIVGAAVLIIYQISMFMHQQNPFPDCWISSTAQHYPQYLIFRICTISGATILVMTWYINYFYLKTVSDESNFNINRYGNQSILIFGSMGAFALMGSTATIDTGTMNGDWHVTCANIFFIGTLLCTVINTFLNVVLYYKTKSIPKTGVYIKVFLLLLTLAQLAVMIVYSGSLLVVSTVRSHTGNILEYTLTYTILAYIYFMSRDVSGFELSYTLQNKQD